MRCLIVEDNEMACLWLQHFLSGLAEIEVAHDGRQGLNAFSRALEQNRPFDLVLLDIVMPEMDGQQALKLLRLAERSHPVKYNKAVIIMTTALDSPQNMEEALWDGDCTDYLVKPVAKEDLLALLRRYSLLN